MRSLKIYYIIGVIILFIAIVSSCFSSVHKYKYTGLYYSTQCSNQYKDAVDMTLIHNISYAKFHSECINDVLLVLYARPAMFKCKKDMLALISTFIESTNLIIKHDNLSCSITASASQRLTKYYFIKGLKTMHVEKTINLIDDYFILSDIVCVDQFDNTDTTLFAFGNDKFGLIFYDIASQGSQKQYSVRYIVNPDRLE